MADVTSNHGGEGGNNDPREKNKANRAKQMYGSFHGSKPYAQWRHEKKEATGHPNHVGVWKDMHCKKGKWYNKYAKKDWSLCYRILGVMLPNIGVESSSQYTQDDDLDDEENDEENEENEEHEVNEESDD
ncbi:hypothetical protein QVD17_28826 [Tagetes erecta]|uniref:Uncharacterized protein n=1 Tax=Tagetes erecta TaxID=13708 RepID=A0AAD8NKS2_TARER|nr:hypothetical protein QVD17_28826 [Tagetes erecta]